MSPRNVRVLRPVRPVHAHVSAAVHAAFKELAASQGVSIMALAERAIIELLRRESPGAAE